ncbi:MAG: MFS transporter [Proteobacteria bacterium]|nr:MFS transporter [Pseudomonadota bacterium]
MQERVHEQRLFVGCCAALTATAFCFACIAAVMDDLRIGYSLTSGEVGMIGGAALWGLALGQLVFAPLCDVAGLRALLRLACLVHLAGVAVLVTAGGFAQLLTGAALLSVANGIVEAACNPLVATLYPTRKAVRLNHFHLWFPGGIMVAGLVLYALGRLGVHAWRAEVALIAVPTLAYGALTWFEAFPATESRRSGLAVRQLASACLRTPLLWLMLGLMAITASLELGPNRWIPSVLEAGGLPGILVLVLINGLMAALRWRAHWLLARLPPTAVLLGSVLVTGLGLVLFGTSATFAQVLLAACVFAAGVAFLWPTMVGLVAERVPAGGPLALGLIAAVGAAFVGVVTTPALGQAADRLAAVRLEPPASTAALAGLAQDTAALAERAPVAADPDLAELAAGARRLLASLQRGEPPGEAAIAWLRHLIRAQPDPRLVERAGALLRPAENAGGLQSFAALLPFAGIAAVAFLGLVLADRRRGGYAAQVARARSTLTAAKAALDPS